MIAAIPAPPEWLEAAATWFCIVAVCCWVMVGAARIVTLIGRRSVVLLALWCAACFVALVVMWWAAVAHSGERTLTFTMPATTQKADASGRLVDCSGGEPVKSLAGWRLYAQVQSQTYVANCRQMLVSADVWALLWPTCVAEAMPRQIRSASTKNLPNGGAGARVTVQAPDSIGGMPVVAYFVTTFNDSLQESCTSNLRGGR